MKGLRMYEDEKLMTFTLVQDGVITSKILHNKDTWYECLQEFLYFLEGAGFTDVRKRVAIDTGVFTADELSWYGPTFDVETDQIKDELTEFSEWEKRDQFIEWDGQLEGDTFPYGLDGLTKIIVKYRCGETFHGDVEDFDWNHAKLPYDVVAYKVI
jgi:hypothetical protein